ncbi:hypothetical protein ABZW11_01075 [Nonomuraea sp. NPDC004580]|uniref:hypothetical protein n=1 Tax=Nonomuraea sp. NPDC004580 TaxID=3154552 RepID=UPI0033A7F04C
MATLPCDLDDLRAAFPGWSLFRSDTGAFYGTRRGVRLRDADIDEGFQQTVGADDVESFVSLLQAQNELEVRS